MRAALSLLIALTLAGGCQEPSSTDDPCRTIGASGCESGRNAAFTCVNGTYHEVPCSDEQVCADGQCRTPACTPSLFFCDGQVADTCDATGTVETRTDCAASKSACVVGPTAASCVARTCTPGTTYCAPDGSEVRKCSPDGMSYGVVQSCADPSGRGNRCVGATCIDRCALTEAQDRSTLGCRFLGAPATTAPVVVIANPQPDLPAQVTVSSAVAGSASVTRVVPPGTALSISVTGLPASGSSLAARALYVTASVPVYGWLDEPTAGVALLPEHALFTDYRAGLDAGPSHLLSAIATANGTTIQASVTASISAGPGVAATAAGTTLTATLDRGQVLSLSSPASLDGTLLSASAPVVVIDASPSGAVALPGREALGRDALVPDPALVVADEPATVTTDLDGTLTLVAGAEAPLTAGQRVSSTGRILVVDQGGQAGGRAILPATLQLRSTSFPPSGGATASLLLIAAAPTTVAVSGGATVPLPQMGDLFLTRLSGPLPRSLTATGPFFALVSMGGELFPGAFGLSILP